MTTFSVVVATYGDGAVWTPLAHRALGTVFQQTVAPVDIHYIHGQTLHEARNEAASKAKGEYLIFLDADDELDTRYIEAMSAGEHSVRQPATLGVYADGSTDTEPVVIPSRPSLREGNWFVIGTAVRRDLFEEAGGFWDEPAWEDWSLMLRCSALGATWESIPEAVYRVGVNDRGRNSGWTDHTNLFHKILVANDQWAAERGLVIR